MRRIKLKVWGLAIIVCVFGSLYVRSVMKAAKIEQEIAEAKAYPSKVFPLLKEYRKEHGTYPKKLELLSNKPPLPRLSSFRYEGYADNYEFKFTETPQGFFVYKSYWSCKGAKDDWQLTLDDWQVTSDLSD